MIIIQVDEIVDCTSPSDFNFQLSTDSLASCFTTCQVAKMTKLVQMLMLKVPKLVGLGCP